MGCPAPPRPPRCWQNRPQSEKQPALEPPGVPKPGLCLPGPPQGMSSMATGWGEWALSYLGTLTLRHLLGEGGSEWCV